MRSSAACRAVPLSRRRGATAQIWGQFYTGGASGPGANLYGSAVWEHAAHAVTPRAAHISTERAEVR
jgi:hypothetical protein